MASSSAAAVIVAPLPLPSLPAPSLPPASSLPSSPPSPLVTSSPRMPGTSEPEVVLDLATPLMGTSSATALSPPVTSSQHTPATSEPKVAPVMVTSLPLMGAHPNPEKNTDTPSHKHFQEPESPLELDPFAGGVGLTAAELAEIALDPDAENNVNDNDNNMDID
ncbi:hypothetical protein B0H14DRAFT_3456137 [Mycena olivaceomarginata]|nr:hypothetical protein B0H14DRAFT_3493973 [Mycena olivaceomarginata]KAJ7843569.1 hypothetical protein B0H14DRAFT_3456137 [Mycena olivaceomarginata]